MGNATRNEKYTRVNVGSYRDDTLLTEAFRDPGILGDEKTYALDNTQFIINTSMRGQTFSGQKVILLRRAYDKRRIAWLLIILLLGAPIAGTTTGQISRKADVGVTVTATIIALAAFSLALLAWLDI